MKVLHKTLKRKDNVAFSTEFKEKLEEKLSSIVERKHYAKTTRTHKNKKAYNRREFKNEERPDVGEVV